MSLGREREALAMKRPRDWVKPGRAPRPPLKSTTTPPPDITITFQDYQKASADMSDTAKSIMEMATAKLRHIDANRERYLEAWIAETGLKPSECMIRETTTTEGYTITTTVEVVPRKRATT